MNEEARKLRDRVEKMQGESSRAEEELRSYENSCNHNFSDDLYDPIHTQAYTCPGDPPGTMGVDWRGPTHVPTETKKRWKRVCETCGLVEYTTQTEVQEVKTKPKWRNNLR